MAILDYANDQASQMHTSSQTGGIHQAETNVYTVNESLVNPTYNTHMSKPKKKKKKEGNFRIGMRRDPCMMPNVTAQLPVST